MLAIEKFQTQFDLKNAQQNCKVAQMPLSNLRHIMEILFQMSPNEIGANRFFGMAFLKGGEVLVKIEFCCPHAHQG